MDTLAILGKILLFRIRNFYTLTRNRHIFFTERLELAFLKVDIKMTNKHDVSLLRYVSKLQIKTTMRYYYNPTRIPILIGLATLTVGEEEYKLFQAIWKNSWHYLLKQKLYPPLLGIYPTEMCASVHQNTCSRLLTATRFLEAINRKQPGMFL